MTNRGKLSGTRGVIGAIAIVAGVSWTGASFTGLASAAYADDSSTLTPEQLAAVQQCLTTALGNVNPSLTGQAKTQAVNQALAQATTCAIAAGGAAAVTILAGDAIADGIPAPQVVAGILPAAIGDGIPIATAVSDVEVGSDSKGASPTIVTQAIIAIGAQDGIDPNSIGTGLGQAAVVLSSVNPGAGDQVALDVANEGTLGMGQAFQAAVIASGGTQQLADLANQSPGVTGSTGQTTAFGTPEQTTGIHGTNDTILGDCPGGAPTCS